MIGPQNMLCGHCNKWFEVPFIGSGFELDFKIIDYMDFYCPDCDRKNNRRIENGIIRGDEGIDFTKLDKTVNTFKFKFGNPAYKYRYAPPGVYAGMRVNLEENLANQWVNFNNDQFVLNEENQTYVINHDDNLNGQEIRVNIEPTNEIEEIQRHIQEERRAEERQNNPISYINRWLGEWTPTIEEAQQQNQDLLYRWYTDTSTLGTASTTSYFPNIINTTV